MYRATKSALGEIPTIVMGCNCNNPDRRVKAEQITFPRENNLPYYDIAGPHADGSFTTGNNRGPEHPIESLVQTLIGLDGIRLIKK